MPETDAKTPETNNRFVGKVQPNVLDYFDTPTYNLKLYMIPESERGAEVIIEDDARGDVPEGAGVTKTFQDQRAEPGKTVILAQTGVTAGVEIDGLELQTVTGVNQIQTVVQFSIRQPNAVNFIDQIGAARRYCGGNTDDGDFPIFLEINFTGYNESDATPESSNPSFDVDQGGGIKAIAGPYIFPLIITNISFQLTETGSTYDFRCIIMDDLVFANEYTKLPKTFDTVGTNIEEHLIMLQNKLNVHLEKNTEDNKDSLTDEFEFDLSALLAQKGEESSEDQTTGDPVKIERGGSPLISNQIIVNPEVQAGAEKSTTQEANNDGDKAEEDQQENNQSKVEEGSGNSDASTIAENSVKLQWAEGTDIYDVIGTLLSMNDEFMQKACRGNYVNGVNEEEITDATEVLWYKMKGRMEGKGNYSEENNKRYKKIIYKPMTFWETRLDRNRLNAKEIKKNTTDSESIKKQIEAMNVVKAYHYYYTGRNDQIVTLDINYQKGITFLVPPQGGTVGDVYANNPISFLTQPLDQSTLLSSLGLDGLFDLFSSAKKLFNSFQNLGDDIRSQIGDIVGLNDSQLKDFLADPKGSIAQGVASAISRSNDNVAVVLSQMQTGGGANAQTQTGVFTEGDEERQKQIDQFYRAGDYDSSPSGYVYGNDLFFADVTAEDIQELQDSTQEAINNSAKVDENEQGGTTVGSESPMAVYKKGPADQGVYSGVKSTLFNYLYNNNKATDFMVQLNMTLRGDPWYLGESDATRLSNASESKKGSGGRNIFDGIHEDASQYLLLEVASPRYFDPDVYDEDNNTGEWSRAGFSFSLSGIYCIIQATNVFQNGLYTIDLKAVKMTGIDLSKMTGSEYLDYNFDGSLDTEYLENALDPNGLSALGQVMNSEFGDKWKNNPQAIQTFLDNRTPLSDGTPRTVDDTLEGFFTSEQKEAYRKWKAEQGGSNG